MANPRWHQRKERRRERERKEWEASLKDFKPVLVDLVRKSSMQTAQQLFSVQPLNIPTPTPSVTMHKVRYRVKVEREHQSPMQRKVHALMDEYDEMYWTKMVDPEDL